MQNPTEPMRPCRTKGWRVRKSTAASMSGVCASKSRLRSQSRAFWVGPRSAAGISASFACAASGFFRLSGGRDRINRSADSSCSFVTGRPPCANRSGARATYPWSPSRCATSWMCGDRPKISWITITPGRGSSVAGRARYAGLSMPWLGYVRRVPLVMPRLPDPVHLRGHLEVPFRQPGRVVGREPDTDLRPGVQEVGMMVRLLRKREHAVHERHGLEERLEPPRALDRVPDALPFRDTLQLGGDFRLG